MVWLHHSAFLDFSLRGLIALGDCTHSSTPAPHFPAHLSLPLPWEGPVPNPVPLPHTFQLDGKALPSPLCWAKDKA